MSKGKRYGGNSQVHNREKYAKQAELSLRRVDYALPGAEIRKTFRVGYLQRVREIYGITGKDSPRRLCYALMVAEHDAKEGKDILNQMETHLQRMIAGEDPERLYKTLSNGRTLKVRGSGRREREMVDLETIMRATHGFRPATAERAAARNYREDAPRGGSNSPHMAAALREDSPDAAQEAVEGRK